MFGGDSSLTAAVAYAAANGGGTIAVSSQSSAATAVLDSGVDVAGARRVLRPRERGQHGVARRARGVRRDPLGARGRPERRDAAGRSHGRERGPRGGRGDVHAGGGRRRAVRLRAAAAVAGARVLPHRASGGPGAQRCGRVATGLPFDAAVPLPLRAARPAHPARRSPAACAAAPAAAPARTVWLCEPGLTDEPLQARSRHRALLADGRRRSAPPRRPRARGGRRSTASTSTRRSASSRRATATRRIDPELRSIARFQAARYLGPAASSRRSTARSRSRASSPPPDADWTRAYRDVRAAWRDYLAHRNHGRGVVLIGHSQGTFHLRGLVAEEIETRPQAPRAGSSRRCCWAATSRSRRGSDAGGDFRHVSACRSADAARLRRRVLDLRRRGPARRGVRPHGEPGREVLCTNPAALGGGAAPLHPMFPRTPFAPGTAIAAPIEAVGLPACRRSQTRRGSRSPAATRARA